MAMKYAPVQAEADLESATEAQATATPRRGRIAAAVAGPLLLATGLVLYWRFGRGAAPLAAHDLSHVVREDQEARPDCSLVEEGVEYVTKVQLDSISGVTNAQACRGMCGAAQGCGAWTWGFEDHMPGVTHVCSLKLLDLGVTPMRVAKYGVVSGYPCRAGQAKRSRLVFVEPGSPTTTAPRSAPWASKDAWEPMSQPMGSSSDGAMGLQAGGSRTPASWTTAGATTSTTTLPILITPKEWTRDCSRVDEDVDYWTASGLYGVPGILSVDACRAKCEKNLGCGAFTWVKASDMPSIEHVCYLKELRPTESPTLQVRRDWISGVVCHPSDASLPAAAPTTAAPTTAAPTTAAPTTPPLSFDCEEGVTEWIQGWSDAKKMWCCKNKGLGCQEMVSWTAMTETRTTTAATETMGGVTETTAAATKTTTVATMTTTVAATTAATTTAVATTVAATTTMPAATTMLPVAAGDGMLYCFALTMPIGYEPGLLAMQFKQGMSLFACDEYAVFSNTSLELAPGLMTHVVPISLKVDYGGEFGTALNADVFKAIWQKVVAEQRFELYRWSVKVDPDCVFMPDRLRHVLQSHTEGPQGTYLNNCKFGMHGPIEVFSTKAVKTLVSGWDRCDKHFKRLCSGPCWWGEDMFIDQCMDKVLDVQRDDEGKLLVEDHCDAPAGWRGCSDQSVVAFHPFKDAVSYQECLDSSDRDITAVQYFK